ncbi:hypothetical protein MPSEU_000422700 [Mayamaea pseudoterrestris]|nr:hypothetical protein MPSEU_000422700 [Mayamaea pseudoterrestris]
MPPKRKQKEEKVAAKKKRVEVKDEDSDDDDSDDDMESVSERTTSKTTKAATLKGDGTFYEKDVLMGRGKRVSEWPGNIYFRQLIASNREKYLVAPRHEKVTIADQVIHQIHSIGGRFLKEQDDGPEGWYEVELERAVEKTCQALREKEKTKTPTGDPFADPNKKTSLVDITTSSNKKKSKKKKKTKKKSTLFHRATSDDSSDDDDEEDVEGDSNEEEESDAQSHSSGSVRSEPEPKKRKSLPSAPNTPASKGPDGKKKTKLAVAADTSNMIQQIRSYDEHEMLKRLHQFKTKYGHCGVPPGWPRDVRLADWCSAQRQVHRETMNHHDASSAANNGHASTSDTSDTGCYRTPSQVEHDLMKELDDMEFVWNYQDWHWKDRYEQLMAVEHGELLPATAAFTRKVLVKWLAHEREHVRTGDTVLTEEQAEDLKRAGICL